MTPPTFMLLATVFETPPSYYTKAHFTLGVETEGRGKSHGPIDWELKVDPKSFKLGVKANN